MASPSYMLFRLRQPMSFPVPPSSLEKQKCSLSRKFINKRTQRREVALSEFTRHAGQVHESVCLRFLPQHIRLCAVFSAPAICVLIEPVVVHCLQHLHVFPLCWVELELPRFKSWAMAFGVPGCQIVLPVRRRLRACGARQRLATGWPVSMTVCRIPIPTGVPPRRGGRGWLTRFQLASLVLA